MKIEIQRDAEGYFTLRTNGPSGPKVADGLNWYELLGMLATLLVEPRPASEWLMTPEAKAAEKARRQETLAKLDQQRQTVPTSRPTLCLACEEPLDPAREHVIVAGGLVHPGCYREPELPPAPESEVPS